MNTDELACVAQAQDILVQPLDLAKPASHLEVVTTVLEKMGKVGRGGRTEVRGGRTGVLQVSSLVHCAVRLQAAPWGETTSQEDSHTFQVLLPP